MTADQDGQAVHGLAQETIGEVAARAGISLHELRTRTATLEDAYLALTRATACSSEASRDPVLLSE